MSPNRREFDERHPPPSDGDKTKLAILWDSRHDCEKALTEVFVRLRSLEDKMTVLETLRASGARASAWAAGLLTGTVVAVLNFVLNYWAK